MLREAGGGHGNKLRQCHQMRRWWSRLHRGISKRNNANTARELRVSGVPAVRFGSSTYGGAVPLAGSMRTWLLLGLAVPSLAFADFNGPVRMAIRSPSSS